jgi:hypothetical protein
MTNAPPDTFTPGSVVAAALVPGALEPFDPILRRFLSGVQLFVKQADGSWCPRGCAMGLPRHFTFDELVTPALRHAI